MNFQPIVYRYLNVATNIWWANMKHICHMHNTCQKVYINTHHLGFKLKKKKNSPNQKSFQIQKQ